MSVSEHKAVEEQWDSLRSKIRERWPQLSEADLKSIDGDSRKLIALIHQRSGEQLSNIEEEIDRLAEQSQGLLRRVTRSAQQSAQQASESVQEYYNQTRAGVTAAIQQAPASSVGIAFAVGSLVGMLIGSSLMRSMAPPPKHSFWRHGY